MQSPSNPLVTRILRRAVLDCLASRDTEPAESESAPLEIFISPAAQTLKEEIIRVGKKLWQREYVDGNGGNLSARIAEDYAICTPTLCSKGDIRPEDLSLVDLENRRICGDRPQTSEILLHLEIYKAVPAAQAVIHCHPPYATAYAITGSTPPGNLIPEQEVFVGPVALAPYETPGTMAFARTVLPFVKDHNTILLTNHGVVCWADTVTHAEWYVEVVENYCKIVAIASQLGTPIREIPAEKIPGLLAMKKRLGLGLPDPRLAAEPQQPRGSFVDQAGNTVSVSDRNLPSEEVDRLVARLASEVLAFLRAAE